MVAMRFPVLFHLSALTILLSCTPVNNQGGDDMVVDGNQAVNPNVLYKLPLAQERGMNTSIMDDRLRTMVNEASDIEKQVEMLVNRLHSLRDDIAGLELVEKVSVKADLEPSIQQATAQPASLIVDNIVNDLAKPAIEPEPVIAKPEPQIIQPVKKAASKPQKLMTSNKEGIFNVRHGIHADKTRLVFDINGSTIHNMQFDEEVGIVTLTLPETKWVAASGEVFNKGRISGYEAKNTGAGTIIAVGLNKARKAEIFALQSPSRLVLDIY
jgi:hypothetical protein